MLYYFRHTNMHYIDLAEKIYNTSNIILNMQYTTPRLRGVNTPSIYIYI